MTEFERRLAKRAIRFFGIDEHFDYLVARARFMRRVFKVIYSCETNEQHLVAVEWAFTVSKILRPAERVIFLAKVLEIKKPAG